MELTQQDGDTNDFLVPPDFGDYVYVFVSCLVRSVGITGIAEYNCIKQEGEVHTLHYWQSRLPLKEDFLNPGVVVLKLTLHHYPTGWKLMHFPFCPHPFLPDLLKIIHCWWDKQNWL